MIRLASKFWNNSGMGIQPDSKFMLWIDAVGGYWVCLGNAVTIGQPLVEGKADLPILADLSSRHARILRQGDGYLIEALREVRVNGRPVRQTEWLPDESTLLLGSGVRLAVRRPHPLSSTLRVDYLSQHRTQPSSDAAILVAETCVLGPSAQNHVVCREWPRDVVLTHSGGELSARSEGGLIIDGVYYPKRGPLRLNSRVEADGLSFNLEPLGA